MQDDKKMIENEYLYWLVNIPVMGAVTIQKIWKEFESFKDLFNIEGKQLTEAHILDESRAACFEEYKKKLDFYREQFYNLPQKGIHFYSFLDQEYPERLDLIPAKPAGLFVKGELPDNNRPTAAIVGARNCSSYGQQIAKYMGNELSRNGIQVVSGLAAGIDGAGHSGAILNGYQSFGVLGCGVNICYPKEHYGLYEAMEKNGGIISEFVLGEQPKPQNFPMRNRIISGLSDVILVIEAREKSGSLITVNFGLEQGKEIFALPGRIMDPLSKGCNQLIQDGAAVLLSPDDVIEYFGIKNRKKLSVEEKSEKGLAKKEKMLYSCLDLQAKFLEELVRESGLTVSECISILLELELKGFIVETARHYYAKKL